MSGFRCYFLCSQHISWLIFCSGLSVFAGFSAVKMVHHTQHQRNEVAKLFYKNYSSYMIEKTLKKNHERVPSKTVRNWCKQLGKNPDQYFKGRKYTRSGNPKANRHGTPALTQNDRLRIRGFTRQRKSLRTMARELPAGLTASASTIRREAVREGFVAHHRSKKPFISRATKHKRLTFAKENVNFPWRTVVFMDIVTISTASGRNTHNDIVWDYKHARVQPRPTTKSPISESRFAIITIEGGLSLQPCKANPKAADTQRLLDTVLPELEQKVGHDYSAIHDNSPDWRADSTQNFLEERLPDFFSTQQYPPSSPDFNLIENTFSMLKALVYDAKPRTRAQLIQAIDTAWSKVSTKEKLAPLYASMKARLQECIRRKGRMTDY